MGSNRVVFREGVGGLEVLQQTHTYPFGGVMEGSWDMVTTPKQDYKFGGKELNEEYGLDLYDHGARWRDSWNPQWLSVDPLAEKYVGWSPYNVMMGNPIRFIDPNGKSVENTIFIDNNGNELGRTVDNLPDAIVVVGDESLAAFNQSYSEAALSSDYIGNDDVANLRGFGDKYYTSIYNTLWEKGQSSRHPAGHNGYKSRNGDGSWIPEVSVDSRRNENNEIVPDWESFTDHEDPFSNVRYLSDEESYSHTHPAANNMSKGQKSPQGIMQWVNINEPHADGGRPSQQDYNQTKGVNMKGLFHVAVSRDNYHFYNNTGVTFKISKKEFK